MLQATMNFDAIAKAIAERTFPGYPPPAQRLFLDSPGFEVRGHTLQVPDGPWQVNHHSNRQGVDQALLDPVIPTSEQAAYWRAHCDYTDQAGRPVHPYWRELLGDERIGLPTGLGAFYRYGPNAIADAIIYKWGHGAPELLLIKQKPTGKWGLPGGFMEPRDTSAVAAARREVAEETGLANIPGSAEVMLRALPVRQRDTLNAWADVTVILIHADQAYLQAAVPKAGDDASDVAWFSLPQIAGLDMLDTHVPYVAQSQPHLRRASHTQG
jgi:ADP-ribose pyrophosphatase YjhB (NUDIX family)